MTSTLKKPFRTFLSAWEWYATNTYCFITVFNWISSYFHYQNDNIIKHKKRLLLRCIHHFKSDLINNMDYMRISYWTLVRWVLHNIIYQMLLTNNYVFYNYKWIVYLNSNILLQLIQIKLAYHCISVCPDCSRTISISVWHLDWYSGCSAREYRIQEMALAVVSCPGTAKLIK